ncbi:MAG: BNR-4 repeat-containing protein [Bacteroidota bacterium]
MAHSIFHRTIPLQIRYRTLFLLFCSFLMMVPVQSQPLPQTNDRINGYRGIWFNLGQIGPYGDKYSGGLGTYTANHIPMAVYSPGNEQTFFVYGGATGADDQQLVVMASWYDHKEHLVPKPTVVHVSPGVDDPHDNPSITLDPEGHIWVFVSGRSTRRAGYIYRSSKPYSTDHFERVREDEFTYPQPWWTDNGVLHLFTRYSNGRELYLERSPDGRKWEEPRKVAGIGGHYQVSSWKDGVLGTFFNRHPGGNVDQRTDLYYIQSRDGGENWTTADGTPVHLPIEEEDHPARVRNLSAEGRLQYTVDLNWDRNGYPILLYVTSGSHEAGPASEPRRWELSRWTGSEWTHSVVARSDHNYDLGSLFVLEDRWVVVGPTGTGPQAWGTGGELERWESEDQGATWKKTKQMTVNSEYNHMYVRRPLHASDPFSLYWADGSPNEISPSRLYFGELSGERYWQLPYEMDEPYATPIEYRSPESSPVSGSP